MKKSKLCLCLLMTTMLVGCNKPTNIAPPYDEDESSYVYTPQDMASRDVQLPTTIPTLNEDSIQIHYHRNDNKYKDWGLWLWDPDGDDDSEVDVFNYMDDFGVTASYPLSKFGDCSGKRLGFIIRKIADWTKDTGSDRFIDFNSVIKDKNGKQIDKWVSTNEPHYIEGLAPGEYTLTEIVAPDGYKLSTETIKFSVKDDGSIDYAELGKIMSEKETAAAQAKEKEIAQNQDIPGGGSNGEKDGTESKGAEMAKKYNQRYVIEQ